MDTSQAVLDQTLAAIARHGYAVISVPANLENGMPGYSYTVGANRICGHDFIVLGLGVCRANSVLNSVCEASRLAHAKARWTGEHSLKIDDIRVRCRAVAHPAIERHMPLAGELASDSFPFAARQIIWADAANRFPDEPQFDEMLRQYQPLL